MELSLIDGVYDRIAKKSRCKFSHLVHPKYSPQNWPDNLSTEGIRFFRHNPDYDLPNADHNLLASLERDGVPTIHNMIISDRVVSKLPYVEALRYATFLVTRLIEELSEIKPSFVIGAYDGIHASLSLAVCRYLQIPWYCLHFSIIPPGSACFCKELTPAARVNLQTNINRDERLAQAEDSLSRFESREIKAAAYIAPKPLSILDKLRNLPKRIGPLIATLKKGWHVDRLKYTDSAASYSVLEAIAFFWSASVARKSLSNTDVLSEPPDAPFVFFGLHLQPESTVDVWAPFYSNQIWVIELLARSIPPTHNLLVKIHKSDISNYSRRQLDQITSMPGVEIVEPFADAQKFIRKADLIVSIQGTIGLEGALFGKPVIMLGDSPNTIFDSVSRIGKITELPALVRRKLNTPKVDRKRIVEDYAKFLDPFMPACINDWSIYKTDKEIDGFVELFDKLGVYVESNSKSIS
jgi:hypothetical protein